MSHGIVNITDVDDKTDRRPAAKQKHERCWAGQKKQHGPTYFEMPSIWLGSPRIAIPPVSQASEHIPEKIFRFARTLSFRTGYAYRGGRDRLVRRGQGCRLTAKLSPSAREQQVTGGTGGGRRKGAGQTQPPPTLAHSGRRPRPGEAFVGNSPWGKRP